MYASLPSFSGSSLGYVEQASEVAVLDQRITIAISDGDLVRSSEILRDGTMDHGVDDGGAGYRLALLQDARHPFDSIIHLLLGDL